VEKSSTRRAVTKSEHAPTLVRNVGQGVGFVPRIACCACPRVVDFQCLFGIRNKPPFEDQVFHVPRQDLFSLCWPKSELKHPVLQMTFVTLTP
jgi:hypothetical protein